MRAKTWSLVCAGVLTLLMGCRDEPMTVRAVCAEAAAGFCDGQRGCLDSPPGGEPCEATFVAACCDSTDCDLVVQVDRTALDQCRQQLALDACAPADAPRGCGSVIVAVEGDAPARGSR